jgi:hypothetical protein
LFDDVDAAPRIVRQMLRNKGLVARRYPQESSNAETFHLPIRPSARFSVLIPNLGGQADGTSSRDRTIGATLAPHAQYAAMLDMHRFYGRSRSFRFKN